MTGKVAPQLELGSEPNVVIELAQGLPALQYASEGEASAERRTRFSEIAGIDRRLWLLVPLGMGLSALMLSITLVFLGNGPAGLWDKWLMMMYAAILTLHFTLPPAILCWIATRTLCWRLGLREYQAAILSSAVAGWGATCFVLLRAPAQAMLILGVPCAVAGMVAAAAVYWSGWRSRLPWNQG